jgi:hypothetical protein
MALACLNIPPMPTPTLVARILSFAALFALAGASRADELRDAVDRVRQETGGYILSAQSLRTQNGTVHRVKVLTRDGRVEVRQIAAGVRGEPLGFTAQRDWGGEVGAVDGSRGRGRGRDDRWSGDDEGPRHREFSEAKRAPLIDEGRYERRSRDDGRLLDGPTTRETSVYGRGTSRFDRRAVEIPEQGALPVERPRDQD